MVYFPEKKGRIFKLKNKMLCCKFLPNLDMFRVLGQVKSWAQFLRVFTNLIAITAKSFLGRSPTSPPSPKWKRNKRLMRTCEELSCTTFVAK
jgi:hypothetical protein